MLPGVFPMFPTVHCMISIGGKHNHVKTFVGTNKYIIIIVIYDFQHREKESKRKRTSET